MCVIFARLDPDPADQNQVRIRADSDPQQCKLHMFSLGEPSKPSVGAGSDDLQTGSDDLEAELEADLENMKLDDIDTSDVNIDDEGLLED